MKTGVPKTKRKAIAFIEYITLCIILLFSQGIARAAEVGYVTLDNCDNVTGWGGPHTIILDTENNMQGSGCISSTGDNLVSFSKVYSPRNTYLTEEEGYLKFWLYISDVSLYDNVGQIEITSSGGFDVDEYSWNMNSLYLKDGWNYMVLNLASAGKSGSPDLSAINFFRVYSFYSGSVTIKIDDIIFDDNVGMPLPGNVLDLCNNPTGWNGDDDIYSDLTNKIGGGASLASLGEGTNRYIKVFTPTDANVSFENGYLNFWLYVSDITALDPIGQVEITSSGGYDVDEYSWPVNCLDLQNGWNYVFLKLTRANKTGDPDLSAINYFRLYNFMNDTALLRLDNICFTENSPPESHIVNPNTLQDKVLFGYQGWFAAPGDGSQYNHWVHWFRNMPDADDATFDCWPDLSEYDEDELYETDMEYSGGEPVKLYSAYNYKTVDRHFKWMYEHQLDGVFLQRFISCALWDESLDFVDKVADNVMKSCDKYERVFAIEFCIQENEDYWVETIKEDWMHLVDDLNITLNPYYLRHEGRPLVGIYGIGFPMYSYATPEEAQELIDWFHSGAPEKYRATVMCGVPGEWRIKTDYIDFYSTVDVIKPWTVGRYNDYGSADNYLNEYILPDKDFCDAHDMDYLPVIWPGFSWYNMQQDGEYQKNQFPRNGGNYYWRQSYNVNKAGVNMIFIAMYDEVDEGTAMYKLEPHHENTPTTGFWVTLDADGYELPSDWYLRLASETGRTLRKEIVNDHVMPEIPNVKSIDSLHVASGIYPVVELPEELYACAQESREVQAMISNASWQNWSVGGSGTSANIYCDQSKEVWVEAGNTCGNSSDTMNLIVLPNPVITLGADDTIDFNQSILISVDDDYVRYLWNDVPGDSSFLADNSTLEPGANNIELTVVDHHNCSASDNQSVYLLSPISTLEPTNFDKQVLVFPNPFNNSVYIVFNEDEVNDLNDAHSGGPKEKQVSLFNNEGRKIVTRQSFNGNVLLLELGGLPVGNYFIRISAGEYKKVFKVVKNL